MQPKPQKKRVTFALDVVIPVISPVAVVPN